MPFDNLLVEVADRIATLTINREAALNVLDTQTIDELGRAFGSLQREERVGGVILTGAGNRAFAAGADIREMAGLTPLEARAFSRRIHDAFNRIQRLGKPVVAAVNGFALGGGCELAMACHLRVASRNATLGQPEVKLGLPAGGGGTQRLARLVGPGPALELLLTGDPISAERACHIGLVNRVVEPAELMPACRELLARILRNAPLAVRYSLEAVSGGLDMPLEEGLFLESSLFGISFATEDMREGTRAFLEKRAPVFRGK